MQAAADLLSCDVRATVRCSAHAKVTPLQCLVGQAQWTSMTSRMAYSTSTPMKPTLFSGYLLINKCVTAVKVSNFTGHYLRNRSTLDIGVLGYIGIV